MAPALVSGVPVLVIVYVARTVLIGGGMSAAAHRTA